MEDVPLVRRNDEHDAWLNITGRFDAPAFVRRAQRVENAYRILLEKCEAQRNEMLQMSRISLGILHAMSDGWRNLETIVADQSCIEILREMWHTLQPKLRISITPTKSRRALRRAAGEMTGSLSRFNRRWRKHIDEIDLTEINRLRDGYNRYYVLEKECYMRSPFLARKGFQPLAPIHVEELRHLFPEMPIPQIL